MRESVLRDYFDDRMDVNELRDHLVGAVTVIGPSLSSNVVQDMDSDFEVQPKHLVKICDEVLAGNLEPDALKIIAFCLIASDHFTWDTDVPPGDIVAGTLFDWSAPEINYPLNFDTVRKFKERLLTGRDLFRDNNAE